MSEYLCGICKATFETNRPHDAKCPACGEPVKRQWVEYTDRDGGFFIGGGVTPVGENEENHDSYP